MARYSIVGWNPIGTLELSETGVTLTGAMPPPRRAESPLAYLRRLLRKYRTRRASRFAGGLIGAVGARFVADLEPSLASAAPDAWPRLLFGLYEDALVYDHHRGTVQYVSRGPDRRHDLQVLRRPIPRASLAVGRIHPATSRRRFEQQVRQAQAAIAAGECFQVVLSRAYTAPYTGDLAACYALLRRRAQAPYLFFLRFAATPCHPARVLLGASPETLVRVRGTAVTTFPIAGTRPRTGNPTRDAAAARSLRADPKEAAEHAMLVDLARNDLARVCRPGSVRVTQWRRIQPFNTVQHLVSVVRGRLQARRDAVDALAAVFPAGTVSGAPKIRALELIQGIEAAPRGPYAGAVCVFSFNGDLDSCIAIRSLSATGGRLTIQAGAGIVAASKPRDESAETRHKAALLLGAIQHFGAKLAEAEP